MALEVLDSLRLFEGFVALIAVGVKGLFFGTPRRVYLRGPERSHPNMSMLSQGVHVNEQRQGGAPKSRAPECRALRASLLARVVSFEIKI